MSSPMKKEVNSENTFGMRQCDQDTNLEYEDRQIPSILSYVGGEEYHGTQAKSQLVRNNKNTVAYFRDFLGKEYAQSGIYYLFNSAD